MGIELGIEQLAGGAHIALALKAACAMCSTEQVAPLAEINRGSPCRRCGSSSTVVAECFHPNQPNDQSGLALA